MIKIVNKKRFIGLLVVIALIIAACLLPGFIRKQMYPYDYDIYIEYYAEEYGLDPYFVAAVIREESRFVPNAQSHRSANGLMQLTDETGEWIAEKLGISEYQHEMILDPETNIRMGCWYLAYLKELYQGDDTLVLAAYNAGSSNVNRWLKNSEYSKDGVTLTKIPFEETEAYVKKVFDAYEHYIKIYKKTG